MATTLRNAVQDVGQKGHFFFTLLAYTRAQFKHEVKKMRPNCPKTRAMVTLARLLAAAVRTGWAWLRLIANAATWLQASRVFSLSQRQKTFILASTYEAASPTFCMF